MRHTPVTKEVCCIHTTYSPQATVVGGLNGAGGAKAAALVALAMDGCRRRPAMPIATPIYEAPLYEN